MGKNQKYSKDRAFKSYGSKIRKRKPFDLIRKAQRLAAEVTQACAVADKNYRLTICQDMRHTANDLVHMLRYANARHLGDFRRVKMQHDAAEQIERLYDEIPILRYCGCITPQKEGEIEQSLLFVKASFENWIRSDLRRLVECTEYELKQKKEKTPEVYDKALQKLNIVLYDYFPEGDESGKEQPQKEG